MTSTRLMTTALSNTQKAILEDAVFECWPLLHLLVGKAGQRVMSNWTTIGQRLEKRLDGSEDSTVNSFDRSLLLLLSCLSALQCKVKLRRLDNWSRYRNRTWHGIAAGG